MLNLFCFVRLNVFRCNFRQQLHCVVFSKFCLCVVVAACVTQRVPTVHTHVLCWAVLAVVHTLTVGWQCTYQLCHCKVLGQVLQVLATHLKRCSTCWTWCFVAFVCSCCHDVLKTLQTERVSTWQYAWILEHVVTHAAFKLRIEHCMCFYTVAMVMNTNLYKQV
jgi:hypothetical protein